MSINGADRIAVAACVVAISLCYFLFSEYATWHVIVWMQMAVFIYTTLALELVYASGVTATLQPHVDTDARAAMVGWLNACVLGPTLVYALAWSGWYPALLAPVWDEAVSTSSTLSASLQTPHFLWNPAKWAICTVCTEILFYVHHRILHLPYLFKHIHAYHHRQHHPRASHAMKMHPLEYIFGIFIPVMAGCVWTQLAPMWVVCWTSVCLVHGICAHSGMAEFDATFHDLHHRYVHVNFGTVTNRMDMLCGTFRKN